MECPLIASSDFGQFVLTCLLWYVSQHFNTSSAVVLGSGTIICSHEVFTRLITKSITYLKQICELSGDVDWMVQMSNIFTSFISQ